MPPDEAVPEAYLISSECASVLSAFLGEESSVLPKPHLSVPPLSTPLGAPPNSLAPLC